MDKRFIFKNSGQQTGFGDDETCDLDFTIVFLNGETIETIKRRAAILTSLQAQDNAAYELVFFDGFIEHHNHGVYDELDDDTQAALDNEGYAELPVDFVATDRTEERAECVRTSFMILKPMNADASVDVKWLAMPKHTNIEVSTHAINVKDLLERVVLSVEG